MRLTDLSPRWVGIGQSEHGALIFGLSFECPHCTPDRVAFPQRLAVLFRPMIDPQGWEARTTPILYPQYHWWTRAAGETFADLTLTPSINAQGFEGHWHGHIIGGEIR